MIALLCSVQAETQRLLDALAESRRVTLGSKIIIEGKLGNQEIILCVGGMGKVNAAHAATLLLTRFEPGALIVFGIGGAYPSSGANIGDVALAKEEIAGDEGVLTQSGFKDAEYIGIPLLKTSTSTIYSTYHASASLAERSLNSLHAQKGLHGRGIHVGPFVTLSTCTGTAARAKELENRYHGLCENMEGAAAAHVAELHTVPWLEVRGISNIVEDRDPAKWDIPKAVLAAQEAVLCILDGWEG